MKTLLALTALMMLLATAIWWKTRPVAEPVNLPPTSAEDPMRGIVTMGVRERTGIADASFPTTKPSVLPSDSGGDHEDAVSKTAKKPIQTSSKPTVTKPAAPVVAKPSPKPAAKKPETVVKVPTGIQHTVKDGENLYRIILRAYGTAPEELVEAVAEANAMRDSSALSAGQKLQLPLISGYRAPQRP